MKSITTTPMLSSKWLQSILIALSVTFCTFGTSQSFGQGSIQDTLSEMAECEFIVNVLTNSEDYYHNLSERKQLRIDTLRAALSNLLSINGLVVGMESDLSRVTEAYKALDESQKSQVQELTKELKKMKRKKNFWKIVAISEPFVTIGLLLFLR